VHELFPVAAGLLLGALLGLVRPSIRAPIGAGAAIALGVVAAVISGESECRGGSCCSTSRLSAFRLALGVAVGRSRRNQVLKQVMIRGESRCIRPGSRHYLQHAHKDVVKAVVILVPRDRERRGVPEDAEVFVEIFQRVLM
jgi:hypothetical protein